MGARNLSKLMVAAFILLGLFGTSMRRQSREAAHNAMEMSVWRLTYDIGFNADEGDAEVWIAIPSSTPNAEIIREETTYPDLNARPIRVPSRDYRAIAAEVQNQPGQYRVTSGFEVRLSPNGSAWGLDRLTELTADSRQYYLREEEQIPIRNGDLQRVLQRASGEWQTDEEKLQWIFDYCAHQVRRADGQSATSNVAGIVDQDDPSAASPLGRARLMVAMCRAAKLPARLVAGFELRQSEQLRPHVWVEVFGQNRWMPFDPVNAYAWHMPVHFVPARRGGEDIAWPTKSSQISQLTENYSIVRLAPSEEVLRAGIPHPVQILDLTRLPVGMHRVMALLLLLPLGALITALFRNVIGIRTFGTFAPALLAMSFIYANWGTGLVITVVVVVTGLVGRNLLEHLHLLMVPRLSIIMTLIILCVLFGVSLLHYLSPQLSTEAVLLPLVILTIMIERFYVTVEEDGYAFAIQMVVGTLVVAAFCYVLLRWDEVGQLMLVYPEAHFFTIAAFIIIGRYSGYRITELWRFRDLVAEDEGTVAAAIGRSQPIAPGGGAIAQQDNPPEA